MEFSWFAWNLTVTWIICEAIISYADGTFSRKQFPGVNLSFLRHWGISVGDILILPVLNGLVVPHLHLGTMYILWFVFAVIATWQMHKLWWPRDNNSSDLIFPHREKSQGNRKKWYRDLSRIGWMYVAFMAVQITIILGYIATPIPKSVVLLVMVLLSLFVPIATLEPYYASGNRDPKRHREAWISTIAQIIVIIGVSIWKFA